MSSKISSLETLDELLDYRVVVGGREFVIDEVVGEEGLSLPFRFELSLRVPRGEAPDPEQLVRGNAILRVSRGGVPLRELTGIVTDGSISATATGDPTLRLLLEPRIALLQYRRDCRVFRNLTSVQIVTQVLAESGIATDLQLAESYPVRPFVVMYQESALAFVSRLLEEEGIAYASLDREPGEERAEMHRLSLLDNVEAYQPLEPDLPVPLKSASGLSLASECVAGLRSVAKLTCGTVKLRDWDIERPDANLDVEARVSTRQSSVSLPVSYSVRAGYADAEAGLRRARRRAEAVAFDQSHVRLESNTPRLTPGRAFKLEADEAESLSGLTESWFVARAKHRFQRNGAGVAPSLRVELGVYPATRPFRPLLNTPLPVVPNVLTAFVTGPDGEDIHCDALGRVKLRFPWDRSARADDSTSHWVPVLQDNTGESMGIPRVGWEVAVAFDGGDPNRPYVVGRVYNGADPVPEPLPAGRTKSALRSLSSPSREGVNEIWMEDAAGRELMSVQAQRDQHVNVGKDKTLRVGNVASSQVVGSQETAIGGNSSSSVGATQLAAVGGNQSVSVAGSRERSTDGTEENVVDGSRLLLVAGAHVRLIGGMDTVAAKSLLTELIGGAEVEGSIGANHAHADILHTLTVGGAVIEAAGAAKTETTTQGRKETVGGSFKTNASGNIDHTVGKRTTTAAGAYEVTAKELLLSSDKSLSISGSTVELYTPTITIKVGASTVVLDGTGVSIDSPKVSIVGSGATALNSAALND